MSNVTVIAKFVAKKGMGSVLKDELFRVLEPTRKETGCLNYDLHQLNGEPDKFLFHENWESEADLKVHLNSSHINELRGKCEQLLEIPVEITLWTRVEP